MSTTTRRKRQYQPSISSFFAPVSHDLSKANETLSRPPVPILPDPVQSSLLNVGMRVRKAVPEGYKTKRTSESSIYHSVSNDHGRYLATIMNNNAGRAAELVSFCGIMKVGGYDFQDYETSICDAGQTHGFQDGIRAISFVPQDVTDCDFPSSQESTASTICTESTPITLPTCLPTREKKRTFDEHDEEDEEEELGKSTAHFLQCAVISQDLPRRPLISRITRRSDRLRKRSNPLHNIAVSMPDLDFGEADFLRFGGDEGEKMEVDIL